MKALDLGRDLLSLRLRDPQDAPQNNCPLGENEISVVESQVFSPFHHHPPRSIHHVNGFNHIPHFRTEGPRIHGQSASYATGDSGESLKTGKVPLRGKSHQVLQLCPCLGGDPNLLIISVDDLDPSESPVKTDDNASQPPISDDDVGPPAEDVMGNGPLFRESKYHPQVFLVLGKRECIRLPTYPQRGMLCHGNVEADPPFDDGFQLLVSIFFHLSGAHEIIE